MTYSITRHATGWILSCKATNIISALTFSINVLTITNRVHILQAKWLAGSKRVKVWSKTIDQTEIPQTVLSTPVPNYIIPLKYSLSILIDCCKRLNQMENSSHYSSLGILFSAVKSQLWWGRGYEKTSFLTSLSFNGGVRSHIHVQSQNCTVGGARRTLCASWYCVTARVSWDWLCRGKDVFLGGSDWTLTADLLDDFGQNCFCIEWPCDGAVRRQLKHQKWYSGLIFCIGIRHTLGVHRARTPV